MDDRGQLSFANDCPLDDVKRFYIVENFKESTVRAFHGHQHEAKYVLALSGSAIVAAVEMDNTEKPNKKNEVYRFVLSARSPSVLHIPKGFANGWKALEAGTKIMFLSTVSMEQTKGDDFRFPHDYWGEDVWKVENR